MNPKLQIETNESWIWADAEIRN